jgi:hypothetical protein
MAGHARNGCPAGSPPLKSGFLIIASAISFKREGTKTMRGDTQPLPNDTGALVRMLELSKGKRGRRRAMRGKHYKKVNQRNLERARARKMHDE